MARLRWTVPKTCLNCKHIRTDLVYGCDVPGDQLYHVFCVEHPQAKVAASRLGIASRYLQLSSQVCDDWQPRRKRR